jgi:hypothetical protein
MLWMLNFPQAPIADWQTAIDSAPKTTYTYYVGADGKPGWIDRMKR